MHRNAVVPVPMLKIQRTGNADVIFDLIGRLDLETIGELKKAFSREAKGSHFVLDLKELTVVDGEAVMFLAESEASGMQLKNCPAYIREWITKERGGSKGSELT